MLGDHSGDSFDENLENGGPFCISFHKSEDHPWDYSCDHNDADHIAGFIPWALSEFPIDPDAVFLHGFSSGGIMTSTLMMASCKVERFISAAAPYAGLINAAPTTKAAFLVIHGTHDDIVAYREDWIDSGGDKKSRPSCECNGLFEGTTCFDNYISLGGPTLAASIAIVRGYTGDVFHGYPEPTMTLDIMDDVSHDAQCQVNIDKCINPLQTPNPWNEGFDCNSLASSETDVIVFPTTEESGPVVLWSINMHNHDYPNKRRSSGGPTELFFQMKSFFNNNRGRFSSPSYMVEQVSTNQICSDPGDFNGYTPPESFFRYEPTHIINSPMTPAKCKEYCANDFRCTDAFYVDYTPYGGYPMCKVFFEPYECRSTVIATWASAVHFKATDEVVPTSSPTTSHPTIQAPTTPPNPSGRLLCVYGGELERSNSAGYACLVNGASVGDSNAGYTAANCATVGGTWAPYNCGVAYDYFQTAPEDLLDTFVEWWQPKCCVGEKSFCEDGEKLEPGNSAGYSCLVNGASVGDSNAGYTAANCATAGGTWTPYNCGVAHTFFQTATEYLDTFVEWWQPKCCVDNDAPTASPTVSSTISNGCPSKCAVPTCVYLDTDGPGWNDEWSRDEDGVATKNGFCTAYCKVYDESTGKALCGDGDWHRSGTDCTGCAAIAADPIISEEEREESSGLCAAVEELSGHALWGTGVKECSTGAEPTNDSRCTVWQSMNGDSSINPERTCRGFCSSFGLQCENGYDDGEDGCLYGGDGIGCDSILGCCSEGGPTPDHVCVCVEPPTSTPSSNPTFDPTTNPTTNPPTTATDSPTTATDSPTTATDSPTTATDSPTTATDSPTTATDSPTTIPSIAPTESPTIACVNSTGKIWRAGKKPLPCWRVKQNWCENSISIQKHCPLKCGRCAEFKCVDSPRKFYTDSGSIETLTCKYLKGLKRKQKRQLCKRNKRVRTSCRKTCKYCS